MRLKLLQHPATTAAELRRYLRDSFGVDVSRQLVSLVLRTRLRFSWKRTRKRGPKGATWPEERVEDFKRRFLQAYRSGSLSSWDESGFDLRCHPIYGYAPRGQRAILNVPRIKCKGAGRHHSLLMAMHMNGERHDVLLQGSVGSDQFAAFVASAPFPSGTVVLLDNHSMHKTVAVRAAAASKGYTFLHTPAYSPEFNPIELMFGATKNLFYKLRYSEEEFADVGEGVGRCLDAAAYPASIQGCFRHVRGIIDGTGKRE